MKVERVITIYAAVAFVILELVDIIAEPFGLTDWILKLVFILLSVGFIITVLFSWIYDLRPGGIEKTKPSKELRKGERNVTPNSWRIATYVSVVIIIGLSGQGYSQSTFKFKHLSVEDGLSQATVTCILKDRNGFMWFGTRDGLNRYDSYDFRQYKFKSGDSTTISNNTISCLFEDHLGIIWIGTEGGGLNSYDPVRDQFQRFMHDPGQANSIPHNSIGSITEDQNGKIWVGTNGGGLSRFDREIQSFTNYTHDPEGPNSLGSNMVMCVMQDSEGLFWLATKGAGLARFDPTTEEFKHYRHDPDNPTTLGTDLIRTVFEDSHGRIWIGSWGYGVHIFDKKSETFTQMLSDPAKPGSILNNNIFAICEDNLGNIWMGTRSGLSCYDPRAETFTNVQNIAGNPFSLADNVAFSLYYDKSDEILWIGTWGNGINFLDQYGRQILHFRNNPDDKNSLSDNDVFSIFEDDKGIVWIGTEGGGLNKYNPAEGTFKSYTHDPNNPFSISNDEVMCIHQDSLGKLWIGTFGGGLNIFDPEKETFRLYQGNSSSPLNNLTILTIYEDSKGLFWLTTSLEGVVRIDPSTGEYTKFQDSPGDSGEPQYNEVLAIIEDHTGAIWFGSRNTGISRLDPSTGNFTYYKHDPENPRGLGSNAIYAFHEDTGGNLWIGTRGAGLNILKLPLEDEPVFQKINTQHGLVNDWILGIEEDQHGNIWASGQGISKISTDTREVKSYYFSESNQGALYKSPVTGKFYLGSLGFDLFHPDSIKEKFSEPQVLISKLSRYNSFEQSGTSIPIPGIFTYDSITFNYRDKILAFEFLSLAYNIQEEREYAYLLEGFNNDWIQLGSERKITFIGLSPGKYHLRVKYVFPSGKFGQNEANLSFTILPPWWRSQLAYGSYVLLFILSLIAFIRWRTHSLEKDKEVLESQVKERTKEIAEQKDEIEAQRDEIEAQRDDLESQRNQLEIQRDLVIAQNREIIDSINYAQRIQAAMLPPESYITELLNENFILYKPRDIVSGDFYWVKQVNQYVVLVAADCTGHGIPGAFMSMLGISYLNEIVQRREITQANQVLNELRKQIKHSLRQHGQRDESKDGMDMAICVIDLKSMKMQYSGANNPLYLIKDVKGTPELNEIKADRMPLGYYQGKDISFVNHDIQLNMGDTFYMFSDGFIDQKGGKDNKKFMSKNFKNLLLEIHDQPMYDQKDILDKTLLDWMGNNSQMDDILVIGVRV